MQFRSYHQTDIMGDRAHVVYAVLLENKHGRKWVYVGQTKDYHTRISQHKAGEVYSTSGSRVIKYLRLKTKLTRRQAESWERYYVRLRRSRSGYPVFGM